MNTAERIHTAFGIIDAQGGFMPRYEAARLGLDFGQLPVPGGDEIIKPINSILESASCPPVVFTTQDWHPNVTAHFSDQPDYENNWPRHCVANTESAMIHPDIRQKPNTHRFIKGMEKMHEGDEDKSYSGHNAISPDSKETLPRFLKRKSIQTLYLSGLALEHCVMATAIDFRIKENMDIVVIRDATKPVSHEKGEAALKRMGDVGIRLLTTQQAIEELQGLTT